MNDNIRGQVICFYLYSRLCNYGIMYKILNIVFAHMGISSVVFFFEINFGFSLFMALLGEGLSEDRFEF